MAERMGISHDKLLGFVSTPPPIARELVAWAVREPSGRVLDLGVGEGVFVKDAAHRLAELGATPDQIADRIVGIEKDPGRYAVAVSMLRDEFHRDFPGLRPGDLFEQELPQVAAVVGNPPYVRRASLDDVDRIHQRLLHNNVLLERFPRLTDLYAYFLIYIEPFMTPGARLAVVLSSSWLDTRSGAYLKRFLLDRFRIHAVVACEARMFRDALVRSVLLMAEKGVPAPANKVRFVRLGSFRPGILDAVDRGDLPDDEGRCHSVPQQALGEAEPWSVYLRNPLAYARVRPRMTARLEDYVESRIGIQPLARDFYIFTPRRLQSYPIDPRYLLPMIYSPRHVQGAILEPGEPPSRWLLSIREQDVRADAQLSSYVKWAEAVNVPIRGKNRTVVGYQNVPRLQQARRAPWYNLADEVARRGVYPVLVPRRFYERFVVVWNKSGAVPGENFVEALPHDPADLLPLLAILNSSYFEIVARCHAQQYGGGVYNLNPVDVRRLPTFPLPSSVTPRRALTSAFETFAASPNGIGRRALDEAVGSIFGFTDDELDIVSAGVVDLRGLSMSSKQAYAP